MLDKARSRLLGVYAAVILVAAVGAVSARGGGTAAPEPSVLSKRVVAAAPAALTAPPPTATPRPAAPELEVQIAGALQGSDACVVVRENGRTIAALNPDQPYIPASTQKLFVAAAATQLLGPEHRFTTSVVASAPPVDGVAGDLWLVGGGDPMLATPEYASFLASAMRWKQMPPTPLASLADAIAAIGIRQVGRVIGDDTRHAPERLLDTWKPSYLSEGNISPMSALTVNSGWMAWSPKRVAVGEPTVAAAAELTRLLRERGVTVLAEPGAGAAPGVVFRYAAVESHPLLAILGGMLHSSDNVTAEMVTRELGRLHSGEGTTAAGTEAIVELLAEAGVDTRGVVLADGSGLNRMNRATCGALADVLTVRPGGVDLAQWLAMAGRSGTLWKRMAGTPFDGRMRAKSGWIGGVVGLAGEIDFGRPLRFAIVQNGVVSLLQGREVERRVLDVLGVYSAA